MTLLQFVRSATIGLYGALAVSGAALGFGVLAGPAAAQTGVAAPPEVTVDLDVLNSLGGAQSPRHRNANLHQPRDRADRVPERKPSHTAAQKPKPPIKKAAARPPRPAKRTPTLESRSAAERDAELREDSDRAARDEAIWEADRKREEADQLKREETARMRQAKAEIEEAAKGAAKTVDKPAMIENIPNPGPGPATPPPVETPKMANKPASPSGQMAAVTPPTAPRPQPPPAPVKPKPAAVEKTSLPSSPHIDFTVGTADLSPAARAELDSIAKRLGADESKRLQLVAYATGAADEANQARRLSLSRALNVRAYLIDHGVRNTRMDVRALGNRPDGNKPVDRVDILFLDK